MADENDIVELGIDGALDKATQSGRLSLKAKSRFIAAIDRFFGNAFDLPGTWLKTKSDRMAHEEEIRQQAREFQLETYKRIVSEKGGDEVARLISSTQWKSIDAQLNLEAIAQEAAEILSQSEIEDELSAKDAPTRPEAETIKPDWLNRFRTHAENASSDELRNLWARILAGEAQRPGKFSASALRFVAEVDKQQADRCELISKSVLQGAIFTAEEHNSGTLLDVGLALQAQGLLAGVGSMINRRIFLTSDGSGVVISGDWALRMTGKPNADVNLPIWSVTELGREVFSLLAPPEVKNNFMKLAELLPSADFEGVELLQLGDYVNNEKRAIVGEEVLRVKLPKEE